MDRRNLYYRQLVTDAQMNQLGDDAEAGDLHLATDLGFFGVVTAGGLTVSPHGGGMSVDVTSGVARDQSGNRCYVPSTQTVDLSVDATNTTTAVSTSGHRKVVSLFLKFNRLVQTPETDGNGFTVFYDRLESYFFFVKQGSESASPTPPPGEPDGVRLCDVTIQWTASPPYVILSGDISTALRQDLVVLTGSPFAVRTQTLLAALQAIVSRYNSFVSGSVDALPATAITYAQSSSTWLDGTHIPAGTVQSGIDAIPTALRSTTPTASGADRIGGAVLPAFADGVAISAGSLFAQMSAVINGLASTINTFHDGARHVGYNDSGSAGGISANNVGDALDQLDNNKVDISKLASTAAGNDGARQVGAEVKGRFATSTARGQLDELDTTSGNISSGTTHVTVAWTFDNITVSSGDHYKLASRSVTRMVGSLPNPSTLSPGGTTTMAFSLPHGVVLNAVTVNVVPTTHSAYPPSTRTDLVVGKVDGIAGTTLGIGAVLDPASNLSQTNANRPITLSGLTETVDRTAYTAYFVQVNNENGTNATSTQIASIAVTCTVTAIDDMFIP